MAVVETIRLEIVCPFCGTVNHRCVLQSRGSELTYCDVEQGGCDQQIAYKWSVEVKPTVHVSQVLWCEPGQPKEQVEAGLQPITPQGSQLETAPVA